MEILKITLSLFIVSYTKAPNGHNEGKMGFLSILYLREGSKCHDPPRG